LGSDDAMTVRPGGSGVEVTAPVPRPRRKWAVWQSATMRLKLREGGGCGRRRGVPQGQQGKLAAAAFALLGAE
jgi:hypothetical protein